MANKAEGRAGDAGALEAFDSGLGEPVPISAEHGEGLADLYARVRVAARRREADDGRTTDGEDKPIRIAIVGRPNAGKSTLVNRLIGEDRLLTGPEAGITRDAISVDWDWEGRRVRLVDTAGLRRKARIEEKLEKLSTQDTIRAITFAEVVVLVMDATHPFETQDLQIADLVEREGRALVFVLAKWDLVEDPQARLKALHRAGRAHAAAAARRAGGRPVGGDRPRPRPADAGGGQGARRLVDQGQDPRPQRLAEAWPSSATRRRRWTAGGSSRNTWPRPRRGRRPSSCSPAAPTSCRTATGAT